MIGKLWLEKQAHTKKRSTVRLQFYCVKWNKFGSIPEDAETHIYQMNSKQY